MVEKIAISIVVFLAIGIPVIRAFNDIADGNTTLDDINKNLIKE